MSAVALFVLFWETDTIDHCCYVCSEVVINLYVFFFSIGGEDISNTHYFHILYTLVFSHQCIHFVFLTI